MKVAVVVSFDDTNELALLVSDQEVQLQLKRRPLLLALKSRGLRRGARRSGRIPDSYIFAGL